MRNQILRPRHHRETVIDPRLHNGKRRTEIAQAQAAFTHLGASSRAEQLKCVGFSFSVILLSGGVDFIAASELISNPIGVSRTLPLERLPTSEGTAI